MTKMTIEDRISLNAIEARELCRSYIEYALNALICGYINIEELKNLFKQVKNYSDEVELESKYLKILETYKHRISERDLDFILKRIDYLNECTYNYYEGFGEYYVEHANFDSRPSEPLRSVPSLKNNTSITDEIVGYTLTKHDINSYFFGTEAFCYAKDHLKVIDGGSKTWIYGAHVKDDHGIIRKINLVVPPVKDLKSALINVHDIRNAIDLYDLIGKPYPEENDFEERARAEEDKFVKEYVRNKFEQSVRNK